MGAVGGLIFDGRVPPGVEVDDVGGGGQVQSGAARTQRKQKRVGGAGLEGTHALFALGRWRGAIEGQGAQPRLREQRSRQIEKAGELAEHQGTMALVA